MQNVIYKDDKDYPELLRQIGKDAPKQIYYKVRSEKDEHENLTRHGLFRRQLPQSTAKVVTHKATPAHLFKARPMDTSIFNNCLAVVGSRKLTHYGKQVIKKLVGEVAMAGITIVSGFMYGGDAAAHKTALKVGGKTIAVMPCGINKISPEDQEDLYNEIIENNGMIISEYEGEMTPALWTYPRRNRIVAGLSKAVLVIEAGEKSGSLITANLAKKFKRKVFAVPGPITSSVSKGTNKLIKDGAEMVTDAKDILRWFRGDGKNENLIRHEKYDQAWPSSHNLPSSERKDVAHKAMPVHLSIDKHILKHLEREPLGIDEMSRDLEISVSELGVKLSMMEMQGLIELKQGKYYNKK